MNIRGKTVVLLVCLAIVLSSFVTMLVMDSPTANGYSQTVNSIKGSDDQLAKIKEAYGIIRNYYVLDVDEERLLEGAIEGMINTLGDPHSEYMSREIADQFKESLQSSFEGIGAEVMMQNGQVTIVAPIKGTPAEKAGLRPNDQILRVNGESMEGLDLRQAVLKIKGPKGTEVVLEIQRPGLKDPISIKMIRDEIPLRTVYAETISAQGKTVGKIEITSFSQETAKEFKEALQDFEKKGMDGLIIDVRDNPGGLLDAVYHIASLLVPNQGIITKIEVKNGDQEVYKSELKDKKPYPITILINEGSASASEILAAALQEAGGYKAVGMPTFGKGTVQRPVDMSDQSQIKLTIAKWLTPKNNWIHEKGVQPDVRVEEPSYFKAAPIQTDPLLQQDVNSEGVRNLQLILQGLGYDPGREDGFFNEGTKQAVQQFQTKNQLKATGVVDEQTAMALQEQLIQKIRDPHHDRQLQKAVETILKEIK